MSEPVREVITGDGVAVGSIDGLGEGPASTWAYAPGAVGRYIRGGADLYELQRKARLDVPDAPDRS